LQQRHHPVKSDSATLLVRAPDGREQIKDSGYVKPQALTVSGDGLPARR
jgi:hypothetical protein